MGTVKLTNRESELNKYLRFALDASWKRSVQNGMSRPARLRSNCTYTTITPSQAEVAVI